MQATAESSDSMQHAADTGELKFGWSNVCMHYFSTAFLLDMAERLQQQGQYHIAKKKIPSKDGPVQASQTSHQHPCALEAAL